MYVCVCILAIAFFLRYSSDVMQTFLFKISQSRSLTKRIRKSKAQFLGNLCRLLQFCSTFIFGMSLLSKRYEREHKKNAFQPLHDLIALFLPYKLPILENVLPMQFCGTYTFKKSLLSGQHEREYNNKGFKLLHDFIRLFVRCKSMKFR